MSADGWYTAPQLTKLSRTVNTSNTKLWIISIRKSGDWFSCQNRKLVYHNNIKAANKFPDEYFTPFDETSLNNNKVRWTTDDMECGSYGDKWSTAVRPEYGYWSEPEDTLSAAAHSALSAAVSCGNLQVNTEDKYVSTCPYTWIYSVSPKNPPPLKFSDFFPNGWEFIVQILHAY